MMSVGNEQGIVMRTYEFAVLALAALILAAAFAITFPPEGSATVKREWSPAFTLHFAGVHRNAPNLLDDDFPPH